MQEEANISKMSCANATVPRCNGMLNLWKREWSSYTFSCPPFPSAWAFGLLGRCETSEASEAAQTVTLTQFSSSSARRLTNTPWSFSATSCWLQWELYWARRHNSKSIPREAVLLASVNWELGIPCSFPNLRAPARAYKVLEPCQEAN